VYLYDVCATLVGIIYYDDNDDDDYTASGGPDVNSLQTAQQTWIQDLLDQDQDSRLKTYKTNTGSP